MLDNLIPYPQHLVRSSSSSPTKPAISFFPQAESSISLSSMLQAEAPLYLPSSQGASPPPSPRAQSPSPCHVQLVLLHHLGQPGPVLEGEEVETRREGEEAVAREEQGKRRSPNTFSINPLQFHQQGEVLPFLTCTKVLQVRDSWWLGKGSSRSIMDWNKFRWWCCSCAYSSEDHQFRVPIWQNQRGILWNVL